MIQIKFYLQPFCHRDAFGEKVTRDHEMCIEIFVYGTNT